MKELQSACTIVPMRARENEYEEFLSCQDEQVWKELSEEWQQYLKEKEESLCLWLLESIKTVCLDFDESKAKLLSLDQSLEKLIT